jgi:hypothetical protein
MLIYRLLHAYLSPLKDGEDLSGLDRGDELTPDNKQAEPTEEEKKLAADLKAKADADAKAKEEADAKAKEEADAKAKEEEEEDDPENPGKKRRVESRIPLARHKALIEAERAERAKAEAKLAQYEKGEDIAKTNEEITKAEDALLKMEADYTKLMSDGKTDEAAKMMTQIRRTERSINDMRTDLKTAEAESRAYERARYDTTVERVEAAYPQLNPDNKEHADEEQRFNPTLTKKVLSVAKAYQIDGMTPSAALQEAVKDLLGEPKTRQQKQAVEVTPRVDEAAAKKAAREEEARRKAADAANATPPSNKSVGKDADKLGGGGTLSAADVMKMSFTDFSKLDEATLSRLRGDMPA